MTVDVATAEPTTSLDEMRALMTERRIRHVPVVSDGRLTGIVSIGDVVKAAMDQLEFERDQLDTTCTRPMICASLRFAPVRRARRSTCKAARLATAGVA